MIDRVLAGRYKIIASIGEGGMSKVWRAQDLNTGKFVAVKVLRDEYQEDETFVRRFEREAQAASRMTHPNIAGLLDVGLEEDGTRYLVIEYVSGKTLKQFIQESGSIKPETAAQIIIRVLAAVNHAHQNGVIHRDIKPQNILIDKEGSVKVSDFGIARLANTQTMSQDTETVMGSVYYFSPEQAKGAVVDEKSDLYSVGAVFYEMLTGQVPFTGDTPVAIAMKHLQEPPVPPSEINPAVSTAMDFVVLHAMEKRPRHRYNSAADMMRDVHLALEHPDTILAAKAELERREKEARLDKRRRQTAQKRTLWMRRILVGVFSVLLLLLTALAGYTIMERILLSRQRTVEVPNAIGSLRADAITKMVEQELEPIVRYDSYDLAPEDYVFDQSIAAGSFVEPGTMVTIVVCRSNYDMQMPNVANQTYDNALRILDNRKLIVENIEWEINPAEYNVVLRQDPPPGTPVNEGTGITLVLSSGQISMPKLTEMPQARAETLISNFSLRQDRIIDEPVDDPAQVGMVIKQNPPAYREVARNTTVTLWVGVPSNTLYRADLVLHLEDMPLGTTLQVNIAGADGEEKTVHIQTFYDEVPGELLLPIYSETSGDMMYTVYYNNERVNSGMTTFSR